jgi:hypothetical protein
MTVKLMFSKKVVFEGTDNFVQKVIKNGLQISMEQYWSKQPIPKGVNVLNFYIQMIQYQLNQIFKVNINY